MTSYRYMSDGLGGHVGLSCSPGLGSAKRVTKNKTHILLFNIILVFLCKSYSFQVEELSLASFKHRLNRNLKPPPRYYNAGSRKGQILQARLRLECSSLNSDLYRKHIVPSERQTYLPNNLRTFTTKDLLFGCENASEQDNQSLFLQVQDFIVNSGRFP